MAAFLLASALAGCGGPDSETTDQAADRPPADECDDVIDQPVDSLACADRSWSCGEEEDRLHATELSGKRVSEARTTAARHGCVFRVVRRDGKDLVVTQDYRTDRINVAVEGDRVVGVEGIG